MLPAPHLNLLRSRLRPPFAALHLVVGPAGSGKTVLLRQALGPLAGEGGGALHWEIPPLDEGGLLEDLDHLVASTLGALPPVPRRPGFLPLPGTARPWMDRLEGVLRGLALRAASGDGGGAAGSGTVSDTTGTPGPVGALAGALGGSGAGVLVLDGMEALGAARRRLPDELLELWQGLRDQGLPVHLVTTWRSEPPAPWREEGSQLTLDLHPFRSAAWAGVAAGPTAKAGPGPAGPGPTMAGASPEAGGGGRHPSAPASVAFHRWLLLGQHPTTLPGARRWAALGQVGRVPPETATPETATPETVPPEVVEEVLHRVLSPLGDLFDAPLRRLEATVQAPARYARILQAMAAEGGVAGWGPVAERVGAEAGNRLAPYLRRLEADGWILVHAPLDGRDGGRKRRYLLADPFVAFWFRHILPLRSLLHRSDPRLLWQSRIAPHLDAHRKAWLPVLARRWLREHAAERLGAEARQVGGLWAGEVELEVAARLANGQVCYGATHAGPEPASPELLDRLRGKMAEVRWGMGREVRAPLLFVAGAVDPELRRRVSGDALAHLLTLEELMGARPPGAPS